VRILTFRSPGLTETDVQKVKEDIERLKVELEKARQDRKNHEEHVAFAKKVREFPSRAQSQEDIDKVRGEIEQLEADKASLDEKTLIRSKQLHLLFFSIQQLLTEIDLDKKDEEVREAGKSCASEVYFINNWVTGHRCYFYNKWRRVRNGSRHMITPSCVITFEIETMPIFSLTLIWPFMTMGPSLFATSPCGRFRYRQSHLVLVAAIFQLLLIQYRTFPFRSSRPWRARREIISPISEASQVG
jgi:hypothetical protein